VRLGLIAVLLFFLVSVSYSQNTKGDKPVVKSGSKRESKFRLSRKKTKEKKPYNRVQGRGSSQANRASAKPTKLYSQKGRFVNNESTTAKLKTQNRKSTPSRVTGRSVSSKTRNVYPQRGPYVNNPSRVPEDKPRFTKNYSRVSRSSSKGKDSQQKWKAISSSRVSVRSATGRTKNVFPQKGKFVNNASRTQKVTSQSVSNRQQLARLKRSSHQPDPPKRKRVRPASASRSYISRRSINAFAGFWKQKPKEEKAHRGDISGRPLRTKNFQTKREVIVNPTAHPYKPKKRIGDRPYKGQVGGYISATRSGKAWRGDIAGRKIRGRNFTSKTTTERRGEAFSPPKKSKIRVGDKAYKGTVPGGGYRSVSGKINKGNERVPVKPPGIGAIGISRYKGDSKGGKFLSQQGAGYSGNIKARRPLKGGGSVSGKHWNNQRQALAGKTPKTGWEMGAYQGNVKVTKKTMRNQGEEYTGNVKVTKREPNRDAAHFPGKHRLFDLKPSMRNQGEEFTGNKKARRPLKGGGSVSGKVWNNQQRAIAGKTPKTGWEMGTYQGTIKVTKKSMRNQGEEYTGNIKATKKEPNKEPSRFTGKHRLFELKPTMRDQGEEYTGNIKFIKKEPSKAIGGFPGKHKQFDLHPVMRDQGEQFTGFIRLPRFKKQYIKNPNSAEEAQKVSRPDKSTYLVNGLQIKKKQQDYAKRPHAADGSMPGIGPGKGSIKASEFSKAMRVKWEYVTNPSSADGAQKTWNHSKAFARATDYQGNIKMKKFEFFGKKDLHPDAKFMKTNKNNTDDERSMLTNFKLWWARVFKKSDTQPDHLKEKYRKPRYDKGEAGLWAD
jgi:hypothetical protein